MFYFASMAFEHNKQDNTASRSVLQAVNVISSRRRGGGGARREYDTTHDTRQVETSLFLRQEYTEKTATQDKTRDMTRDKTKRIVQKAPAVTKTTQSSQTKMQDERRD
jgi:hypothetical protein